MQIWGLYRPSLFLLDVKIRVPASEHSTQLVVEGLDSGLQEQMGTLARPLHLLPLAKALAHHREVVPSLSFFITKSAAAEHTHPPDATPGAETPTDGVCRPHRLHVGEATSL
jgi:hypothetical protein